MSESAEPPDSLTKAYKRFPLFPLVFAASQNLRGLLEGKVSHDANKALNSQQSDPRNTYLKLAIDEIDKLLYKVMAMFANEAYELQQNDSTLAIESIREDQAGWKRKQIELLIELACFNQTNDPEYYRHLLSIREYQAVHSVWSDWKEFYECDNTNHARTLSALNAGIAQYEKDLNLEECWYLQKQFKWLDRTDFEKLNALASFRGRLKRVLPSLRPYEKLFIGITYHSGYGVVSSAIHTNVGSLKGFGPPFAVTISQGIIETLLGCLHCLIRIAELSNLRSEVNFQPLIEAMTGNELAESLYQGHVDPKIEVGEVVNVPGGTALVTSVIESKYGYKSYQVHYNGEPLMPDVPTDCFIAPHVSVRHSRDEVAERWIEQNKGKLGSMLEGIPKDELREIAKDAIMRTIADINNQSGLNSSNQPNKLA